MEGIRLKNVRTLRDTGMVDLKTINILVGGNSSGKSTFLRVFPLIKQSLYRRTNGPILWAGEDDDYVDFGSYNETLNKSTHDNYIELQFRIPFDTAEITNNIDRFGFIKYEEEKYENVNDVALLSFKISNKNNKDSITSVTLRINNDELCVSELNKYYYNGREVELNADKDDSSSLYRERYIELMDGKNSMLSVLFNSFRNDKIIEKAIRNLFDNYIEEKDYYSGDFINVVRRGYIARLSAEISTKKQFNIETFNKGLKLIGNGNDEIKKFLNLKSGELKEDNNVDILKMIYMNEIGKYCANYIQSYFMRVCYIKPVRAHANRYYRLTNLSVEDIDADGKNLPLFIHSLSEKNLEMYNKWIYEYFNFKVVPKLTDGHVSLYIEKNDNEINLSDTGYGYSQLLPIITQLWLILNMGGYLKNESPTVFAIEQPELHLHPELQAKLIDLITKIAKNKKGKIQFILETHSEVMINRMGNLIYKNKISQDDVNVILFEKEKQEYNTKVQMSKYNKEGYLENWPIGFFSVGEIE